MNALFHGSDNSTPQRGSKIMQTYVHTELGENK